MAYRGMGACPCKAIQSAPAAPGTATGPALGSASSAAMVGAFNRVWIFGAMPDPLVLPKGLEPILHDGKGTLLAVSNSQ